MEVGDSTLSLIVPLMPIGANTALAGSTSNDPVAVPTLAQQLSDSLNDIDSEDGCITPETIELSARRFVAMVGFCLLTLSNAAIFICFAAIVEETKAVFEASAFQVNLLTGTFYITYTCATPFAAALMKALGVRVTLLVGAWLNLVGAFVKLLAAWVYPHYGLLFAGQLVSALPVVCILPIPPVLAARWFSERGRTLATTICVSCDNIGIAVGLLLSPVVVNNIGLSAGHGMIVLFVIHTVMSLLALVLLFLVPDEPPKPPSAAEAHRRYVQKLHAAGSKRRGTDDDAYDDETTFVENVKKTMRSFWDDGKKTLTASGGHSGMVIVAAGSCAGTIFNFAGLLPQILEGYGISGSSVGLVGFISIGLGSALSVALGTWVGKSRQYRVPVMTVVAIATVAFVSAILMLKFGSTPAAGVGEGIALRELPSSLLIGVCIVFVVAGTALYCHNATAFEFVSEVVFPVNQDVGSMMMVFIGNNIALISTLVIPSYLLAESPSAPDAASRSLWGLGVLVGGLVVAFVLYSFCHPKLARLEHEKLIETQQQEEEQLTRRIIDDDL